MSPSRPRIRRSPPERTRPVRNPVVPPGQPAPGIGTLIDATVGEALRTAERLAAASGATVQGAVECGVKTAYTVIDEYMRRGREAASRQERPNWRSDMKDDRQNFGNWSTMFGPMGPLMAPWMQMMQAWTTAMSSFVPGAAQQPAWNPYAWGGAAGGPHPPGAAASPMVSVQVSSHCPTEVSLSVAPGADAGTLVADALPVDDGSGAPPLVAVAFTCTPGHVRVSVTVPNDQPAGRYSGAVRDAAGMQVGDLTVDVSGPATRPRRRKA